MDTITDITGTFELHNGVKMPYLGLGVYQAEEGGEVENAIGWALDAGYRHIDTASFYGNEKGVGDAVNSSSVPRDQIFVTTKVWNADQGYQSTLDAFEKSMELLNLEVLDLYLVHWPVPGKYKDTWRAMEVLYRAGKVRAIGVSNFLEHQLELLLESSEVVPMVNQMEFHPYLQRPELIEYCRSRGIQYEAWSPLMQGAIFEIPAMKEMAEKYDRSIAQIVLRWDLQRGVATIPKSSKKHRIEANGALFDFVLAPEDMRVLDAMDQGHRFGPDPDNFDF